MNVYTHTYAHVHTQAKPSVSFTTEELDKLTDRIQNAGTEVVNAKAGAVSLTNVLQWNPSMGNPELRTPL